MANPDSLDWFILRDVAHIHGIDPILGYLSIFAILDKLYFKHCKDSSIGYFKLPSGSNLRSADIQDGWPSFTCHAQFGRGGGWPN